MYAAGAKHSHKAPSVALLESIADGRTAAALDAETLQEIAHRYRALDRWPEGRKLYDLTRTLFPDVIPVTGEVLDRAGVLLDEYPQLMARDALHAAVIELHGLEGICSYDRDFDQVRGLRRLEP